MKERDFVYWLNGFFELTGSNELNKDQVAIIKEHLALVFKKETLSIDPKFNTYCGSDSLIISHDDGIKYTGPKIPEVKFIYPPVSC